MVEKGEARRDMDPLHIGKGAGEIGVCRAEGGKESAGHSTEITGTGASFVQKCVSMWKNKGGGLVSLDVRIRAEQKWRKKANLAKFHELNEALDAAEDRVCRGLP